MNPPFAHKPPLVSVIIPTYNRAGIVGEAVDSVLAQDYPDYELIVVDDGSTDATAEVLNRYGDKIRTLRQKNRGVSAARNAGIRSASGEFFAFLDSDDLWLPSKLGLQVAFFDRHPDAVVCQTEEIWIRNGVRVNPRKRHRKPSGMIFEPSLQLCLVSPSAVMIRRSLFDQVGLFDESLPACEDYDLWLRVSCRYPVYRLSTALVVKRGGHSDQLSRQPGLDRYRIQALLKIIESGRLSKSQTEAAVRMLRTKSRIYAAGCRKRGRVEEATSYEKLVGKTP
ncbi:MAG: glycosyl transferase [Deltaproteobacteria bacterium SG8_13]|nr:MAG: glycosyl transferase [Deltaproteobacteria bacterium SG8_13]